MRRIISGRDALVMGVATLTASFALVMSLASSPMVSLALQATETATGMGSETPSASGTPSASATTNVSGTSDANFNATMAGTMMVSCVDTTSAQATSESTSSADANATADASATAETTMASTTDTSTGNTGNTAGGTSTAGAPVSFLGVVVAPVADCGVRISQVLAGSPAELGQLSVGDLIVAVNGMPLTQMTAGQTSMGNYASMTTAGFFAAIHALPPGSVVTLTVQRGTDQIELTVTLVELGADNTSSDIEGTPSATDTSGAAATSAPATSVAPTTEATATFDETVEATATP